MLSKRRKFEHPGCDATFQLATMEASDEYSNDRNDHVVCYTISAEADFSKDIVTRYIDVVNYLAREIRKFYDFSYPTLEFYEFEPVLVATNVGEGAMEMLPSTVNGYHVKMVVLAGDLFITNLSSSNPHSAGVVNLISQAGKWCADTGFQGKTNNTYTYKAHMSAPDVVLDIPPGHNAAGIQGNTRAVIVELEVSNRSIIGMRRDYLRYFAEPTVYSVVGIKMLQGDCHSPCQRCVAVQWTRQPGQAVIEVQSVRDFGILSLNTTSSSSLAASLFEQDEAGLITPVPRTLWPEHRHVPVSLSALALPGLTEPVGDAAIVRAAERFVRALAPRQYRTACYGGVMPTISCAGDTLRGLLHNLPDNWPVDTPDFVIDLGSLFYNVQRSAPIRM